MKSSNQANSDKDNLNRNLLEAINGNKLDKVKELLRNGANPDHTTKLGQTALFIATKKVNKEIVQLLLDEGASINIKNPVTRTTNRYTALEFANSNSDLKDIVEVLTNHEEKIKILQNIFNEKFPALPNLIDDNGRIKKRILNEDVEKNFLKILYDNIHSNSSKITSDNIVKKILSKITPNSKKTFDEITQEIVAENNMETKEAKNESQYLKKEETDEGYSLYLGDSLNLTDDNHFPEIKKTEETDWELVSPSSSLTTITTVTGINLKSTEQQL